MTGILTQQRCWNHEPREAVCRCPVCSRHFCRECVTEHESRLLCATCLQALTRSTAAGRQRRKAWLAPAAAFSGLAVSWLIFYAGGELLLEIAARAEQAWHIH